MIPLHIAQKLISLQQGAKLPASGLKHEVINSLLAENILEKQSIGRSKGVIYLASVEGLKHYIHNRFGIENLQAYVDTLLNRGSKRTEAVRVASNSKIKSVRSFTGFMVATLSPMDVLLAQQPFTLLPQKGIHFFVYDYEKFVIPEDVTIVGIENAENFLHLEQQASLFNNIKPLFVCRYPYSRDLLKWLINIPNPYLHFGDIDFAGIDIFLHEYHRLLGERATFFVPPNIDDLLHQYGNRDLYNKQRHLSLSPDHTAHTQLSPFISLLHNYKKGLEQEILISKVQKHPPPANEK